MKDISIGIYHKDHQYGKRLMEYLNHQKDFPMTASFTSDEEMFFKQEQEGDFECLVLAEETDYHGDFPVCRIGANESMGGMYCQSAKEIAAGIYHCLNVSPQIENERIFGVYSPISRLEISAFARNMAASNGWIYFGMQPYSLQTLISPVLESENRLLRSVHFQSEGLHSGNDRSPLRSLLHSGNTSHP